MQCISPLTLRREGIIDTVPCGKCNFCLSTKRTDWTFRLNQELKKAESAKFVTLTYNDDQVPTNDTGLHELKKADMQLFFKRLRKQNAQHTQIPVRHYTVGEYGTKTYRPHYHSILFNAHAKVINNLDRLWPSGHIHVGDVTMASIHYVTKYVINRINCCPDRAPPFAIMSRRPGIGANYLTTHTQYHRADQRNYTHINGQLAKLPRYYKDKIFHPWEKQIMAQKTLELTDQQYRDEIERLTNLHDEPFQYYEERRMHKHDNITNKINQLNKI
jgi:hypothetical protein